MGSDIETIGTWVAFALTLMVYCYLGRDIPFLHMIYRVVASIFVGVALGYGAIMAWHNVLVPRLWLRLESRQWWYIVPFVLCLLLLTRVRRSWRDLGRVTIAFLFGVGAALAIGGGLTGTLIPQVQASFVSLNPADYQVLADRQGDSAWVHALNALLVVIGTVSTLMYFYFTTHDRPSADTPSAQAGPSAGRVQAVVGGLRKQALKLSAGFGKVFIMFTFGALFATTAISRISLLVDRVRFIIETLWSCIPAP